jgi:hypothetical protein
MFFTSPLHDYKIKNISTFFKNISTFFKNVTTFFFFNISSYFRLHFTKCCNMFWDQHFFNQQMLVSSTITFCKMLQHFLEMLEHFFYLHHLRCRPAAHQSVCGATAAVTRGRGPRARAMGRVYKTVGNRPVYCGNRCYWSGPVAKPVGFPSPNQTKRMQFSVNQSDSPINWSGFSAKKSDR